MSIQPPDTSLAASITPRTTLIPAINTWRIYLDDQGNSPHTVKAFTADVNLLATYLPPDRQLGSITTTDLNNFLGWMQKGRGVPCSPKTLARRITSLKAFFRWLHKYGVFLVDPGEKVVQQSVISPLPTVLTPNEVQAVLKVAREFWKTPPGDTRYFALLDLLLSTGIKKSETIALRLNHVDLDGLRYFNVYGPRESHKGRMASVAFHHFHQFRADGKVKLFEGSHGYAAGEQRRDFVHVDDVIAVNLHFWARPVSGIYNVGTGRAQAFNDVALAVVNTLREDGGQAPLPLAHAAKDGLIEYVAFPEALRGKYQAYTQADLAQLRAAGCEVAFRTVEHGTASYVRWLLKNQ